MIIKKILIFILFLFSINQCVIGQTKREIEDLLQKQKISGAVWAIVQKDSIKTFGSGYKNLQTKELLTIHNKVHVGSITKTILALGCLMLETQGKIDLDEPIKKYLPNLPLQNPWEATNPITVRHLLDHTSGLGDLRLWHFFSSSSKSNTPLSEFYTQNTTVLNVQAKPGTLFSYSNMGYTLLGMLIEQITHQPYEKYLDDNLLKPIGMDNSTFQFTSQIGKYKIDNLAMGHFENGKIALAYPIYLRPAAQFTTTAMDMGILIKFILNKGKIDDKQIIDSIYFEKMGQPNYTIASKKGLKGGYSFGISLRDRHGVVGLAHSGNIVGYRSMLYVFPNEQKGFFISHNMDSEIADYDAFNKVLIEALEIPKTSPHKNKDIPTKGFEEWAGYYIPKIVKIEPFKLLDIIGSFTKIEITEVGMNISPFQKKSLTLYHKGKGLFQAIDRLNTSHLLYEEGEEKLLTTGIYTMTKVNGWYIVTLLVSLSIGFIGLFIILILGIYQTIKYKFQLFQKPIFWIFLGILFFLISLLLIISKNIVFIGDKNLGSLSLYLVTLILPIVVLLSLFAFAYYKTQKTPFKQIGFWATWAVLQLLLLFFFFGLIPFSTWV